MFRRILLLLVPIAILANALRLGPQIVFVAAFLALIPLASLLAEATEELAIQIGPRIGGLLNATLGTMTELIIMFALLRSEQIHLLKASIVGSILISLLFTVGVAILFGGIRNGMQRFDRQSVGLATTTMILAVVGLLVPTLFSFVVELQQHAPITAGYSCAVVLFLRSGSWAGVVVEGRRQSWKLKDLIGNCANCNAHLR